MGAWFRQLRDEARLTQAELAERSGIPISTIRSWEQDVNIPRLDLALRLARVLGVTMDRLTAFDEPPPPRRKK
jgi:transcriptional regulator with XRE-family HTH domain